MFCELVTIYNLVSSSIKDHFCVDIEMIYSIELIFIRRWKWNPMTSNNSSCKRIRINSKSEHPLLWGSFHRHANFLYWYNQSRWNYMGEKKKTFTQQRNYQIRGSYFNNNTTSQWSSSSTSSSSTKLRLIQKATTFVNRKEFPFAAQR